jgi:tetratricopeptide (TPR) repeat protein
LLTRLRSRYGDQHRDVADAQHLLGAELLKLEQYDQAESALDQALRIRRKLFGDESLQAAQSAHDLADLHLKLGRADRAEPLLLETYSSLETNHPADKGLLRSTAALLAQLYDQRGEADNALVWRARIKPD